MDRLSWCLPFPVTLAMAEHHSFAPKSHGSVHSFPQHPVAAVGFWCLKNVTLIAKRSLPLCPLLMFKCSGASP